MLSRRRPSRVGLEPPPDVLPRDGFVRVLVEIVDPPIELLPLPLGQRQPVLLGDREAVPQLLDDVELVGDREREQIGAVRD